MRSGAHAPRLQRYQSALRLLRRTAHTHQCAARPPPAPSLTRVDGRVREYHNRYVKGLAETRDLWAELPPEAPLEDRLAVLAAYRASGARPAPAAPAPPPAVARARAEAPPSAAPSPPTSPAKRKAASAAAGGGGARGGKKRKAGGVSLDAVRQALCAGGRGCRLAPAELGQILGPGAEAEALLLALRFLARPALPGPFAAWHDDGADGEWEWVGGAAEEEEHWWRYDMHGPPPRNHGEAEQLASAERSFREWAAAGGAD